MKEIKLSNMSNEQNEHNSCCAGSDPVSLVNLPMAQAEPDDAPCCGAPAGPPSSPFERPGYTLCHFVDSFVETASGAVPRISFCLGLADYMGAVRARLGISRDQYKVSPGLYSVGTAGENSPVLVTANYKLSFDHLRRQLAEVDAWILVLDTRGINVWCAAGKKTFSTAEIIRQVKLVGLERIVKHREIILPQLGAPGLTASQVKKGCGFKVIWGPIRAEDIKDFLENNCKATGEMRQLTFTLAERIVLVPVEISLILKPSLWVLLAIFILSGIGPEFSVSTAFCRWIGLSTAYIFGVLGGAVAVPILLPWLPGRAFYLKGILTGVFFGMASVGILRAEFAGLEAISMMLISVAVSSYAAMNFTGATPYASPSGVEKEMRVGIPVQAIAVLLTFILWIGGPFYGV